MRIIQRFFALFMAVLLLLPLYIAFADDNPPDLADGGDVVIQQAGGQAGGEDEIPEQEDEDTGGDAIPEDEIPPDTGEDMATPAQTNGVIGARGAAIQTDYINSQAAFENWITDHFDGSGVTGGSITLGANVTLKSPVPLSGPLHIDAGAYGLTLNGGAIGNAPFSISGEGVDVPVLTIVYMGRFSSPWDNLLNCYDVTAWGRNGVGGVAVRVQTSSNGSPDFLYGPDYTELQGHIHSEGAGAVGVLLDYSVKAHFLSVSVEGENSAAIKAPNGASLYYCKLEAGEGSKLVSGGIILLDTCGVSGDASGADVVNRKIVASAGSQLYWPLVQGQDVTSSSLYLTFNAPMQFLLSGDGAHQAEVRQIYVKWDWDKIFAIDTSDTGEPVIISGELYDAYRSLGFDNGFSLALTTEVRDGGKPCIVCLKFYDPVDGKRSVYFQTNDLHGFSFVPKNGNFILWRSDDEGESWYDFTGSSDVSLAYGGVTYYYDEITNPVWFRIQETGGEYSNIAAIHGYEGKTYGLLGGDRTGTDRGGEESMPDDSSTTSSSTPSPPSSSPSSPSQSSKTRPDDAVQTYAELPLPVDEIPASEEAVEPSAELSGTVSTPPPPVEWESDTTTAVSGERLRMMIDAGQKVTFIKNEVRLSFDSAALKALGIGDSQLFAVTVERSEQGRYVLSARLDETELYGLPCVATLDGNKRDVMVSGTYDLSLSADETDSTVGSDTISGQTLLPDAATAKLSYGQADHEQTKRPADAKEKSSAKPLAVFALLGTGCAAGAAAFVKFRVKRHDR